VPNASLRADPVTTGSIGGQKKSREDGKFMRAAGGADLMSPESIAEQRERSEPASVFNLPRSNVGLN
jgi:hypothetical protein